MSDPTDERPSATTEGLQQDERPEMCACPIPQSEMQPWATYRIGEVEIADANVRPLASRCSPGETYPMASTPEDPRFVWERPPGEEPEGVHSQDQPERLAAWARPLDSALSRLRARMREDPMLEHALRAAPGPTLRRADWLSGEERQALVRMQNENEDLIFRFPFVQPWTQADQYSISVDYPGQPWDAGHWWAGRLHDVVVIHGRYVCVVGEAGAWLISDFTGQSPATPIGDLDPCILTCIVEDPSHPGHLYMAGAALYEVYIDSEGYFDRVQFRCVNAEMA